MSDHLIELDVPSNFDHDLYSLDCLDGAHGACPGDTRETFPDLSSPDPCWCRCHGTFHVEGTKSTTTKEA